MAGFKVTREVAIVLIETLAEQLEKDIALITQGKSDQSEKNKETIYVLALISALELAAEGLKG